MSKSFYRAVIVVCVLVAWFGFDSVKGAPRKQVKSLSSPKEAFAYFSRLWDKTEIYPLILRIRSRVLSRDLIYKSMCTVEFQRAWQRKVLANSREKYAVRCQLSFKKLIPRGNRKVTILAKVSVLWREKYWDTQGREKTRTSREKRFMLFSFVKEDDSWRLFGWWEACQSCQGTGKCATCKGKEEFQKRCSLCKGAKVRKCSVCHGTGKEEGEECFECEGRGKTVCLQCGGKGTVKGFCTACLEGLCPVCEGEKVFNLLKDLLLLKKLPLTSPKRVFRLTTPEQAVKTFISIRNRNIYQVLKQIERVRRALLKILREVGSQKLRKIIQKQDTSSPGLLMASQRAPLRLSEIGRQLALAMKNTAWKVQKKTGYVIAYVPRLVSKEILVLVKRQKKWLINNVGVTCSACQGKGNRGKQVGGLGDGDSSGDVCSICRGRGVRWVR